MIDHERQVLTAIVPDRRDLLMYALTHLSDDHFRNDINLGIWRMVERYYTVTGGVLPKNVLGDLLGRAETLEASKRLLYETAFEEIEASALNDYEFRYSVDALKDIRAHQKTGEALTSAFEILERGMEVGRDSYKGHKDARQFAYSALSEVDALDNMEAAPEGDMRREKDEVLAEYKAKQEGTGGLGVMCGVPALDNATGGFNKGELGIIAAFTSTGKSQFACQAAWYAAVMQGKNVFFATSETVRPTIRRRILGRHSRLSVFGNPRGLNTRDIRDATLDPEEYKQFLEVMDDLDNNPSYGKIYIAQIPRGATLSYLEARANRQQQQWNIDFMVVDSLNLLKSDRQRMSEREELNDVLKDSKTFAVSFNEGNGVPLLSPWQIRRESYQEALKTGYYTLSSLSDTSEAEKSADQIVSALRMPENKQDITMQFLKLRDDEIPDPATVEIDFRNAYFGDKGASGNNPLALNSFGI